MPALASEQGALAEFLSRVFPGSEQMNSFASDVLSWKYFSSHPEWSGPRSYVVKKDGALVGHAGIWPLRLVNSTQQLQVIHLIDWAAARTEPGAGISLLRKLAGMSDLLLTIGGSADTQAILPKIGYRRCGELKVQARPVGTSRQLRTGNSWNWKTPLRIIRNAAWSLLALPSSPNGWVASRTTRLDEPIAPLLDGPEADSAVSRRTAGLLNHFLTCPGAEFSAFHLSQSERVRGYFLLSQVRGQTRIVDIGIDANDPQGRTAACILAARTAAEMPGTCEIVAGFSCSQTQACFAEMGFKVRRIAPIFCYDPRKLLGQAPRLGLSMLDGDLCFMANLQRPYLT